MKREADGGLVRTFFALACLLLLLFFLRLLRELPDPAHVRLGRMTYIEAGEQAVESFTDYKKVGGIQVAHTRASNSPQGKFDTVLDKVTFNAKVPDSTFAKPK